MYVLWGVLTFLHNYDSSHNDQPYFIANKATNVIMKYEIRARDNSKAK